jgi:hypothetical protein
MAHARGTVTAEHEGKTYRLDFNFGVLADLEDEFGTLFGEIMAGTRQPTMRFVLRAVEMAMIEADPSLRTEAAAIARRIASVTLFASMTKAAFPDAEVEVGDEGNGVKPRSAA